MGTKGLPVCEELFQTVRLRLADTSFCGQSVKNLDSLPTLPAPVLTMVACV